MILPPVTRRRFLSTAASAAAYCAASPTAWADKNAAGLDVKSLAQQIDGFGFSEAFHQARHIQQMSTDKQKTLLDLLFSPNGMGFSILRNSIGNTDASAAADRGDTASIEPAQGTWNWAGDEDQIWLMNEAKKRGVTRFISCAWSPPAWMKTSKSAIVKGELRSDMYQAYADYLATYVVEYKKRYDLDIYGISPANEPSYIPIKPGYACCDWTGDQLTKFLRNNLIPTFQKQGISTQIMLDDHARWSDEFINVALGDSVCAKAIDIVCAHAYAKTDSLFMPLGDRTGNFNIAKSLKKRIWQTEVSSGDKNITSMDDGIYWAQVLHAHLNWNGVSAWLYWWGAAVTQSRSSLISIDPQAGTYQLSKRLLTLGQYARFVRPGAHRINATENPIGTVRFDAFFDPSGKKIICIAINDDLTKPQEFPIQIGNFTAANCIPVRTSPTENHSTLPAIKPANGQILAQLPPESVTTFVIM